MDQTAASVRIDARAGRDTSVVVNHYQGPDLAQIESALFGVLKNAGVTTGLARIQETAVPAHERYLSEQLDKLRDGAKDTDPDTNLKLFHSFMDSLPADASATIRFPCEGQHWATASRAW